MILKEDKLTKARTKGAKDKGPRKRKGQRIQELKNWADSEPKYRIKPRKRLSLRGDAPGLHYQYPSRESFGLEKARKLGAKDIKPRKRRLTTGKDWGLLPKPKAITSEEKKFWEERNRLAREEGKGYPQRDAAGNPIPGSFIIRSLNEVYKALEVDGKKYSKKRTTGDHDITERRKIAEPKTKTQEFVGETNKALYVILADVEKARTLGAKDTKPRKKRMVGSVTSDKLKGRFYVRHPETGANIWVTGHRVAEWQGRGHEVEYGKNISKAIATIDEEFEKARTPGAKDKGPRKRRLSSEHPKPFPFKNKMIQVNTIFHKPTTQIPTKPIVRYGTLTPATNIRPTWTGD